MRFEAKGWYEAERGLDARGGPDAWRGNRRPGAGAIGLRNLGQWVIVRRVCAAFCPGELGRFAGEADRFRNRVLQLKRKWYSDRRRSTWPGPRRFDVGIQFWILNQGE